MSNFHYKHEEVFGYNEVFNHIYPNLCAPSPISTLTESQLIGFIQHYTVLQKYAHIGLKQNF